MKFKVDENLPTEIAQELRAAGHDADTVADQGLVGSPDRLIAAKAQSERRAILTMDLGIADVRAYPPEQYAGIVLLRPRSTGRSVTLAFFRRHVDALLQAELEGHLLVISEAGIRIR